MDYKELMDRDNPLLDKFRQLAPGTFKHCQNVSNMVESVGAELGLDVDLLKCAGMYHDIGKMNNPEYFSENQSTSENIHDTMKPYDSYRFITSHLSDGVLILLQNGFPIEVINVISEHHGDTILRQFHRRDDGAPEDRYRYKSRKPRSAEAVVLMITDSVEATARSEFVRRKNGEDNIDFIRRIIQSTIDRLDEDDQLDQVVHGVIKQTKRILAKELESIYHKRVSYDPEESEGTTEEK